MSEYILRTTNVTKTYGRDAAVDHVSMAIKKGDIFGLIGQNGAGKSTMLRLVTGLSFPTSGTIEWFGNANPKEITKAQKRMGAIIEHPALFPNMSAVENLEVHRLQKGIPGKECIANTLALVGLQHTGRKKVKNFSLGMKQRLGIAITLLGDPEFLVLDEPTNGLDPIGIVELRELIKKLNVEKGLTVLISSHILSELHLLATTFGIIHEGRMLEQISAEELDKKCRKHLQIKVDQPEKATAVLENSLGETNFDVMPDGTLKLYAFLDDVRTVSKTLTDHELSIEHLSENGDSLENYFSERIGGASID